jgi:hypothetical protein
MTITVKLTTPTARARLDDHLGDIRERAGDDRITEKKYRGAIARLVFEAGASTKYLEPGVSASIGRILELFAGVGGVRADFVLGPPDDSGAIDPEPAEALFIPHEIDPQIKAQIGHLLQAAKRARVDKSVIEALIAATHEMSAGRVRREHLESVVEPNLSLPGRPRIEPLIEGPLQQRLAWGSTVPAGELESIVLRHVRWLETLAGPHRWQAVALLPDVTVALYRGNARGQASLTHRDLRGVSFASKKLSGANFVGSVMDEAMFARADLAGAWLADARARAAIFVGADLRGADFSRSDLRNSRFKGARCAGTDFENCDLTGCDFSGVDLTEAKLTGAKR